MTDVAVRVPPFTFTSLAGVVPDADRDAWFGALRAADAIGELWVCALCYVVAGARP
jgi:hypothetical protein